MFWHGIKYLIDPHIDIPTTTRRRIHICSNANNAGQAYPEQAASATVPVHVPVQYQLSTVSGIVNCLDYNNNLDQTFKKFN